MRLIVPPASFPRATPQVGDPWPQTGRMVRGVQYSGNIDAPMSDIKQFPFDLHDVTLKWLSLSTWQTHDMSETGSRSTGSSYTLSYIAKHQVKDGDLRAPWQPGWRTTWPVPILALPTPASLLSFLVLAWGIFEERGAQWWVFTASRVQSTCGGRLTPHFLCPQAC